MSDIFLSYARADKQKAERLADAFSREGWSVWWDREIPPGQSFDETIETALNSARCIVVLWSRHSVGSRWVKTEAAEGAERGILVPVLIERIKIPLEFKRIEAADLSGWQSDVADPEFDHLLKTIGGLIEGSGQARPTPVRLDAGPRPPNRWKVPGLFAGFALGVLGSVAVLYQTGFLARQDPASEHAGAGSLRSNPSREIPREEKHRSAAAPAPGTHPEGRGTNLLSAENGGHVVTATTDQWRHTIDGDEKNWQYIDIGVTGGWAVYGFRGGQPARFDTFKILILGAESWNLNEFELLAGNDSPTGKFESLGRFRTQNVRFFQNPFQEFTFPEVRARYLKLRVISSHGFSSVGVYEFQLIGTLD